MKATLYASPICECGSAMWAEKIYGYGQRILGTTIACVNRECPHFGKRFAQPQIELVPFEFPKD